MAISPNVHCAPAASQPAAGALFLVAICHRAPATLNLGVIGSDHDAFVLTDKTFAALPIKVRRRSERSRYLRRLREGMKA